jgi:hypothetical protein
VLSKNQNNGGFSLITPSSMPILRAETDLKFRRYFMGIQNWSEEVILVCNILQYCQTAETSQGAARQWQNTCLFLGQTPDTVDLSCNRFGERV